MWLLKPVLQVGRSGPTRVTCPKLERNNISKKAFLAPIPMLRPDRASLPDLLCLHSKCQKVTPTLCELLTNGKKQKQKKATKFWYFMIKIIQAKSRMFPSTAANHQFTWHLRYHYINRLPRNKLGCGFTARQALCSNCQDTAVSRCKHRVTTPPWKPGKLLCI